ncbi:MAG: DUF5606 domain-containing protein [Saprospiraceae bacterium]|nr:DUF5606 domain-containing protein [Bacteroidia bacterium]NNE14149.1 DUF5606 domain-containing protein [Saprospiraceae bacterium]NNL90938.1 DUF5606 domain-containing protein [Saprospiraceae bacterium]
MNLESIISVSGEQGLFNLVASRNNGLVLEHLESGKSKFYSVRKHQFTPLGTVAIYTLTDTKPLQDVFETMLKQVGDNPPVDVKSETINIEEYFESILPDYDEDRVSLKDMKKVIKWFNILNNKGLLSAQEEE